ncbi:MAG: hypothetical protein Q4F25_00380 [Eubacteriales bacterium]|nr:hypothetical protein [Eubacteriales bacterium]
MTHRILVTALYGSGIRPGISYYCTKDLDEKALYCDAVVSSEASCKYILSSYPIEEIIVFGTDEGYHPGEEAPAMLRDKMKVYPSDLGELSSYGLLKYRLMQFFDEISVEDADQNNLLSEEEQKRTIEFLRRFFRERIDTEGEKKITRYFHYLLQDRALCEELTDVLRTWVPDPETDPDRYRTWILQYLYRKLKATSKLEPLEQNESVRIRFIRVERGDIISVLKQLLTTLNELEYDDGVPDDTELYGCLNNDHVPDIFFLLNSMNLIRVLPKAQISIRRVITETRLNNALICEMSDKTQEYNISELLSGTDAFLRYGKTDLLVEYWRRANLDNPKIERIIYAMRNIDSGISLCDITDIERGIRSLRSVIKNDLPIAGKTEIEQYFEIVIESVRHDYGALLEEDQISFIDLAKWAYRKGFWQQTLTLIESRAPRDFVEKGIYFYSDGEKTRRRAVEILGQTYYDLKQFEKYKLDDVAHYFVKYYGRNRAPRSSEGDAYQMIYTDIRMEDLDTHDEKILRAHTICPDRAALKELLFAYYHLGDVRNLTNHAEEEYGGFYRIMADTDPGERAKVITKAIDYFLNCYDTVSDLIRGRSANVETVRTSELMDYANIIREENRRDRNKNWRNDKAPAPEKNYGNNGNNRNNESSGNNRFNGNNGNSGNNRNNRYSGNSGNDRNAGFHENNVSKNENS